VSSDATHPPTDDRRARQRERRREALYEAAIALFMEQGFEGTTMDDIASKADVARATVFNHFPQKTSFLQEWAMRRRQRAREAAHEGATAGESLRDLLVRYFSVMGEPREATRSETVAVILGTARSTNIWARSPLADELSSILTDAQRRGEVGPEVDADHVGQILASAYYVVLTSWASTEPAPFELVPQLIKTVDLLLNGVLPRP
jgi:AcrR family transcriptional regulator